MHPIIKNIPKKYKISPGYKPRMYIIRKTLRRGVFLIGSG